MKPDNKDPYQRPAMPVSNRLARGLWGIVYIILFRSSPIPLHGWRRTLLRLFGATIGPGCHIYPRARIWAPWNLNCEDAVAIADEAIIYNPCLVILRSHTIISQQAYLCCATHDYDDPAFLMISQPITLEPYSWVCARATVQMGVTMGAGSILGLGAIATRDLEAWSVYAGNPARKIKDRKRQQ